MGVPARAGHPLVVVVVDGDGQDNPSQARIYDRAAGRVSPSRILD
jgi:accessory colonization factor AcfC